MTEEEREYLRELRQRCPGVREETLLAYLREYWKPYQETKEGAKRWLRAVWLGRGFRPEKGG